MHDTIKTMGEEVLPAGADRNLKNVIVTIYCFYMTMRFNQTMYAWVYLSIEAVLLFTPHVVHRTLPGTWYKHRTTEQQGFPGMKL